MSKTETGNIENDHTARMLSGDELDAVSGGFRVEIGSLPCDRYFDSSKDEVSIDL